MSDLRKGLGAQSGHHRIEIGACVVLGAGWRVALLFEGQLISMSPAKARRLARGFETPEAAVAGVGWVADSLRQFADQVEAATAVKH
jgi:hypothetical protein